MVIRMTDFIISMPPVEALAQPLCSLARTVDLRDKSLG
jgi:hypothetical protein